jgi:hypothetical protein
MSVHHHQIAVPAVRPVVWIQPACAKNECDRPITDDVKNASNLQSL